MDSIWTIGLGFVLFNIVLVILLNIVSNYIYDRVPIKAVVSVSIVITGTLGIIWGLWTDKIPMLLGINLIVAMMLWILLTSSRKKVQISFRTIISVIIAVTSYITIRWGMGSGKIEVLSGVTLILLMVIWIIVTIFIDVISSIIRIIENLTSLQEHFISLHKNHLAIQKGNLASREKIIEVFGEALQLLGETQLESVSLFKEAFAALQKELNDNEEELRKNTEELHKFEKELSNTVKIPKLFRK